MTATAHALVGGAIAASIQNPALGLPISLISHPILDMVPHWDFGWGWKKKTKFALFVESLSDLVFGILLSFVLFFPFSHNFWYFSLCIILAELPDLAMMPYLLWHWNFPPFSWAYKIQAGHQGKAKLPWGILNQVVSVILIVVFLQIFIKF